MSKENFLNTDWIEDVPIKMPLTEWIKFNNITNLKELIGLKVLLREDTEWWSEGDHPWNPHHIAGTIIKTISYDAYEPFPISVRWEGDRKNIYRIKDLDVVVEQNDLNEDVDKDFDWIEEIPVNPFYLYDGIKFDVMPTENEVNEYIEMALDTGKVKNSRIWERNREVDIRHIIRSIKEYGHCFLEINKDSSSLQYGTYEYGQHDYIKFSKLKSGEMNESNDINWIQDVPVNPFMGGKPNKVLWVNTPTTVDEIEKILGMVESAGYYFNFHEYAMSHAPTSLARNTDEIRYLRMVNGKTLTHGEGYDTFYEMNEEKNFWDYDELFISEIRKNFL